jgi:arginyl-tRNA synthetase
MNIEKQLQNSIKQALEALFEVQLEVALQPTKKDFEGTYTFVTFPLVKQLRKNPVEIGNAIGNYLVEKSGVVSRFNVVQGFLNLSISDNIWIETLNQIITDASFGQLALKNQSVMVEFSSPNTNKPLHLGHLRNNFLGDSIARILKANGYEVVQTCLVNDRGIHICKSMLAYQKYGNGETSESSGIKGDHLAGKYYVLFDKDLKREVTELVASGMNEEEAKKKAPSIIEAQEMLLKWEQNDPEVVALWHKMNAWVFAGFNQTYQTIGVGFDKTYYESNTYLLGKDLVEEGLTNGVFFKKENGSVWIDLKAENLDEKLVLRSDGTSVYITQDLGTTDMKFKDFPISRAIWVVGNEQDYHFQVLFAIMKRLGRDYADGCYHLSYGMVELPEGKMKSREGTVVDADDLVEVVCGEAEEIAKERGDIAEMAENERKALYNMIGLGALKYFLLKVDPKSKMLFNPKESVQLQGNTGPYIQYTHARICSVLRKAEKMQVPHNQPVNVSESHQIELDLIYLLSQYPNAIQDAANEYSPAVICQYAYELAKTFNQFYHDISILNEPDLAKLQFRIALSNTIGKTISKAMKLIGVDVPQRM